MGVLTHNAIRNHRLDLLFETLRSLRDNTRLPFETYIVDNCSTDGTAELVESLGGAVSRSLPSTCGHGMNITCSVLADVGDLCVFSNDDIYWKPDYLDTLVRFWDEAPEDLLVCSGHLEPVYRWNTAREVVECGGVKALVRDTAPGGTWTFRARYWPLIGPVPETPGIDDVPTCERLRAQGYRVAQMDVAMHVGEDKSSWGNASHLYAQPLDRAAWGI